MIRRTSLLLSFLFIVATSSAQAQLLGRERATDNVGYGISSLGAAPATGQDFLSAGSSQFTRPQGAIAAPEYSPVLMNATSLGAGAVGSFPLHNDMFLRISLISLYEPVSTFGAVPSSQGVLMPVELGVRVPFMSSRLNTLGYTLYGEGSAGMLFGWAFPTSGSFLNYSLPYSRFTTGASAYLGIGNSLRLARFVGLYLNGGVGYYNFFSTSFMPQTRYVVPSVSVGFMFNFTQG